MPFVCFPQNAASLGDRKTREALNSSSAVAEDPAKVAGKQGGEPDEKEEEETQPADKDKEEKSNSTVSKNMEQITFLVRVVCLLARMKTSLPVKSSFNLCLLAAEQDHNATTDVGAGP